MVIIMGREHESWCKTRPVRVARMGFKVKHGPTGPLSY